MDIVEFLTAQYDEDEAVARGAGSGPRWIVGPRREHGHLIASELGDEIAYASPSARHHIARHDPARVLADVAAKRRRLEMYNAARENWRNGGSVMGTTEEISRADERRVVLELVVRLDTAPYAGRPGYNPDWSVQ